jgi:hypothetical protein
MGLGVVDAAWVTGIFSGSLTPKQGGGRELPEGLVSDCTSGLFVQAFWGPRGTVSISWGAGWVQYLGLLQGIVVMRGSRLDIRWALGIG